MAKVKRQPKPKQPKEKALRAPKVAKVRLVLYHCPECDKEVERSQFPGHVDEHILARSDEADRLRDMLLTDERRGV